MNKLSIVVIVASALYACGNETDGSVGGGDAGMDSSKLDATVDATPDATPDAMPDAMLGRFGVGGNVQGLNGALELAFTDGVSEVPQIISFSEDGSFTVPDVRDGTQFLLSVFSNSGVQTCQVENGEGTVSGADVVDIVVRCADLVFFRAYDPTNGTELWVTDGTEAGTRLVEDIYVGLGESYPEDFVNVKGWVYFSANSEAEGRELFRTDGSEVFVVPGIVDGPDGSFPEFMTDLGGRLIFTADDGTNGRELWVLDDNGVAQMVVPGGIASGESSGLFGLGPQIGNKVFFVGASDAEGQELWVSDGTEAGTQLVKDIHPGIDGSSPYGLVASGSLLYFIAFDGETNRPFVSDGTSAGTTILAQGGTGPLETYAPVAVRGGVVFLDNLGTTRKFWFSDGTPNAASEIGMVDLLGFGGASSALGRAFFVLGTAAEGYEYWVTDGTMAATGLLLDIYPETGSAFPTPVAEIPAGLLFSADDGTVGSELWLTDGTAAGTKRVLDIHTGAPHSDPRPLGTRPEGHVFYATDAEHGREPWISDGTPGGTRLLRDIVPGVDGSDLEFD